MRFRRLAFSILLSCCVYVTAANAEPLADEHKNTIKRAAQTARENAITANTFKGTSEKRNPQFWTKVARDLCGNIQGIVKASDSRDSNYWNAEAEYCFGFVIAVANGGSATAI